MEIKGKVHLFFEQSGTFKNEFKKLGILAEDYDIQNNFGETDHVMDLFGEIDRAYDNLTEQNRTEQNRTVFDTIDPCKDLVVAFYPCIYFCAMSQMAFYLGYTNYRCLSDKEKIEKILERSTLRTEFYDRLIKFVAVCLAYKIRMILENPWSEQTFLKQNFLKYPDVVDMNRMERGDYFQKPTAYWFWNCEHTNGFTYQNDKQKKTILNTKGSSQAGICSEDRSMISSDYARNWICDFVLGKTQNIGQLCFDF